MRFSPWAWTCKSCKNTGTAFSSSDRWLIGWKITVDEVKFILSNMRATMWRQSSSFPKQPISYSLAAKLQAQILPRRETTGLNLQGNLVMSHASQHPWLQQNKGFGSHNSSCSTYLTRTVGKWQCFQDQFWIFMYVHSSSSLPTHIAVPQYVTRFLQAGG